MIKKAIFFLFFSVLMGALFLPLTASADGDYTIFFCPKNYPEYRNGKCCQNQDCAGALEPRVARYEGMVPCGKCLDLDRAIINDQSNPYLSKSIQQASEHRCGAKADEYNRIYLNCQLCHFFTMLDDIVAFVVVKIIPPLAILILVIGGAMFYLGGAKPDMINRGKNLLKGVVIGLFLIYGSYMMVGALLRVVGVSRIGPLANVFKHGVFSINCPISAPHSNYGN